MKFVASIQRTTRFILTTQFKYKLSSCVPVLESEPALVYIEDKE